MRVVINGREMEVAEGSSLQAAVESLGLGDVPMVAEVDGVIVPHEQWGTYTLCAGNRVELVRFVGGG